jgi:hypothetical protein
VTVTSAAASPDTASQEMSPELIGLRRRFGSVVAVAGLGFSVLPGEVFGFLRLLNRPGCLPAVFASGARHRGK